MGSQEVNQTQGLTRSSQLAPSVVRGNDDVFQHKLRSIEAYRSQLQIASLVDSIRQDGPYEYLRDVHFRLYSSKKYRPLFAE